MKSKTRTTIKDIAKLAGVSTQAVSLALRDAPDISVATKRKVQEIANQLNYHKNATASNLRLGSSRIIAIVYDELKNFYYSIMIDFIQSYLRDHGYSVLFFSYRYSFLTKETYSQAISAGAAGIISFLEPDQKLSEYIQNYSLPLLVFGRRTEVNGVDCIYTDDLSGGKTVAKRFIEKGCKNPIYVTVPHNLVCSNDRLEGLKMGFNGKKIPVLNHGDKLKSLLIERLTDKNEPCDCIFCFNDMLAFQVIGILQKVQIKNVLVVGYDDIQAQIEIPVCRLTTIGVDKELMVKNGMEILLSKINGKSVNKYSQCERVFLVEGATG